MHKNVVILIVVLTLLVIVGYGIWIKNQLEPPQSTMPIVVPAVIPLVSQSPENSATASSQQSVISSPSATAVPVKSASASAGPGIDYGY